MNMSKLEWLGEVAESKREIQRSAFTDLKQKLLKNVHEVDDRTNEDIYTLWTKLETIHDEVQRLSTNSHSVNSRKNKTPPRRRRGRKRKNSKPTTPSLSTLSSDIGTNNTEPPKKRRKSSRNKSSNIIRPHSEGNMTQKFTFNRKAVRAQRKHHRLCMSTDNGSNSMSTARTESSAMNLSNMDSDEEGYLRRMLVNAQSALQLTELNMTALQHCIQRIDEFKDSVDADIVELADEMRTS